MGLGLRMSITRSKHSLNNRKHHLSHTHGSGVVDTVDDAEVLIKNSESKFGFQPLMRTVRRFYRSIVNGIWNNRDIKRNVDEELGKSSFSNPSYGTIENLEFDKNPETEPPSTPRYFITTISSQDDSIISDQPEISTTIANEFCNILNNLNENNEIKSESPSQNNNKMVEMSEDANFLVYRRGGGGHGANRLRRVASSESEASTSDDSLIAGPPMIDFNEPLPNIPENVVDEAVPNPVSTGDVGSNRDLDVTLPHAVSNTSRENLQSVVSQLGLDIPIQSKNSCHSPQHLHSPHHSTCCRHAAHNISIESLDLDITGAAAAGGLNYCCGNPGNNKFGRRLLSRRSCSSIH